jgi:hypothetical protein
MSKLVPRPRPCASCPYRLDVPSGIWHESEYAKLPRFDGTTGEQAEAGAFGVFMCHQVDGHLCSGWVACHDMDENLAIRMDRDVDCRAVRSYATDVAVFGSGAEAAEHGMAGIGAPASEALSAMEKIATVRAKRGKPLLIHDKRIRETDPKHVDMSQPID